MGRLIMADDDVVWFRLLPARQARIRKPAGDEFESAWRLIGMHNADRRRVLVWRVPADNPGRFMVPDGLMRIPFLVFSDETIEDRDDVILPILDGIMRDAEAARPMPEDPDGRFVMTGDRPFPGWVN